MGKEHCGPDRWLGERVQQAHRLRRREHDVEERVPHPPTTGVESLAGNRISSREERRKIRSRARNLIETQATRQRTAVVLAAPTGRFWDASRIGRIKVVTESGKRSRLNEEHQTTMQHLTPPDLTLPAVVTGR